MLNVSRFLLLCFALLSVQPVLGQKTLDDSAPEDHFQKGIELFDYKKYFSAKESFELYLEQGKDEGLIINSLDC